MGAKDTCDIYCYDKDKVQELKGRLENKKIGHVTNLFKVLSDEKRAKIVYILSEEQELCVCDVANVIGVSVATASHHLRTLKNSGIVDYRKEGKLAFYSLTNEETKSLILYMLKGNMEVKR